MGSKVHGVCRQEIQATTQVFLAGFPSNAAHNPQNQDDVARNPWIQGQCRDNKVTRRFQRYGADYVPGQFIKAVSTTMETDT